VEQLNCSCDETSIRSCIEYLNSGDRGGRVNGPKVASLGSANTDPLPGLIHFPRYYVNPYCTLLTNFSLVSGFQSGGTQQPIISILGKNLATLKVLPEKFHSTLITPIITLCRGVRVTRRVESPTLRVLKVSWSWSWAKISLSWSETRQPMKCS
jgi:hypothetical protein